MIKFVKIIINWNDKKKRKTPVKICGEDMKEVGAKLVKRTFHPFHPLSGWLNFNQTKEPKKKNNTLFGDLVMNWCLVMNCDH